MIVFCHLLNDNSGSPIVLREAIRSLASDGDGAVLFVGSQGRGSLETAGAPIRRYWYRRSRYRVVTLVTFFASQLFLYRALASANLPRNAVIYVNTLLPFGAALWARLTGRALIVHVHEISISPPSLRRFLVRIVENTARKVVFVSDAHRACLPIAGVTAAVVPNPIAPEIADIGFETPYVPQRSGQFDVLMLASPRDFKGVPQFIDLARRLSVRDDVRFTLVLNADPSEILRYLPPSTLPSNVEVHPRTDTPEAFYARADVLLNLSRVDLWVETFGLTIVEAMAFGLPVIAPPIGGPAEIVTDCREGFLVDSRNIAALEQRLLTLVNDSQKALSMSTAARLRARDYTIDRFTERLRYEIAQLHTDLSKQDVVE